MSRRMPVLGQYGDIKLTHDRVDAGHHRVTVHDFECTARTKVILYINDKQCQTWMAGHVLSPFTMMSRSCPHTPTDPRRQFVLAHAAFWHPDLSCQMAVPKNRQRDDFG